MFLLNFNAVHKEKRCFYDPTKRLFTSIRFLKYRAEEYYKKNINFRFFMNNKHGVYMRQKNLCTLTGHELFCAPMNHIIMFRIK